MHFPSFIKAHSIQAKCFTGSFQLMNCHLDRKLKTLTYYENGFPLFCTLWGEAGEYALAKNANT